jgi:hypothetical protein
VLVATHIPPQLVVPVPHTELHIPVLHVAGAVQRAPQRPQLARSRLVSTQAVPQRVSPVPQRHIPPEQVCSAPQALPQRPQLALSVMVFTHVAPHIVVVALHWQRPATHPCPAVHALPQRPQLALSVCTSRHTLIPPTVQVARGATQDARQVPPMHT